MWNARIRRVSPWHVCEHACNERCILGLDCVDEVHGQNDNAIEEWRWLYGMGRIQWLVASGVSGGRNDYD
jgi:hypothetical protein